MRGTKAKRLRAAARQATRYVRAVLTGDPGPLRWVGYRRVYQDSKQRAR